MRRGVAGAMHRLEVQPVPPARVARHSPLVSSDTLLDHLEDRDWVVFDCRFRLGDPSWGRSAYADGHIPGAFHADVETDLSAPVGDGAGGRHPLPDPDAFADFLVHHGVGDHTQVVCYDDEAGQWAARLWWLCRDVGIPHVALLDGGLNHWQLHGLPVDAEAPPARSRSSWRGTPGHLPRVTAHDIAAGRVDALLDARAPERYRGDAEPVDPVAGHIPGAVNVPFASMVGMDGRFLGPDELRARLEDVVGRRTAVYCGSGVTASQLVAAADMAGLPLPALYPGSWSAWCHPDAGRPVERGEPVTARS